MAKKKWKLNSEQVEDLKLNILSGKYTLTAIARKFCLDHSTVSYYKKKITTGSYGPTGNKAGRPKEKQKANYFLGEEIKIEKVKSKTYEDYLKEDEKKRIKKICNCDHCLWVKKCSKCGVILESDSFKSY